MNIEDWMDKILQGTFDEINIDTITIDADFNSNKANIIIKMK